MRPGPAHTVKLKVINKTDALDSFKVKVDNGKWVSVPTSERYYELVGQDSHEVSSLLFRDGGDPVPATKGAGFLFDNVFMWTQHS